MEDARIAQRAVPIRRLSIFDSFHINYLRPFQPGGLVKSCPRVRFFEAASAWLRDLFKIVGMKSQNGGESGATDGTDFTDKDQCQLMNEGGAR
jgi:hypothetical protein